MQIIQTIRDKGAAIVIVVISLSLIGFILMDANQGQGLFGSFSTDVGKVNGETIELNEFQEKVRMAELMEQQRTGQAVSGTRSYQLREDTWNQIIAQRIFLAEAEKLGIQFTSKELSYILMSNEPNNPLLQEQSLRDPNTGKLNVEEAQKAIANIKKLKGEQRANIDAQVIEPLKVGSMVNKYSSLLTSSAYYPEWMKQKDIKESTGFAHIKYVMVPYSELPDSVVRVTDADINAYVQKNKGMFKQEAGKIISYISFSQKPSADDSLRTFTSVQQIAGEFAADTNTNAFLLRNGSTREFNDAFQPRSAFGSIPVDSIAAAPGGVYGPFIDGNNYVIAKLVGTKMLPDSVRAKHILITTSDRETGEMIRDEAAAKQLADSLLAAINAGSDFTALAAQYSADGSRNNGGDLGMYGYGMMVPEFQEFTFTQPVGSRGVVQTQFGYHVIEVTAQKDFNPGYKIALMAREIIPGDATINQASLNATKASALDGAKTLAEYAEKNGLSITRHPVVVKENDYSIGALDDARQLIRWVNESKPGAVSEPFSIGDQFVVATVEKEYKEGVQDAETARIGAEAMIIKEKKAEMIIGKMGANPTLDAAASAYGKEILEAGADSSITMVSPMITGVGIEPKVVGASFNKNYLQKPSPAFGGTMGVFVVQTQSMGEKAPPTEEEIMQRSTGKLQNMRSQTGNWYEGLRKLAKIKDNRSTHF